MWRKNTIHMWNSCVQTVTPPFLDPLKKEVQQYVLIMSDQFFFSLFSHKNKSTLQVTVLQLEKLYGKNKDAKEFIKELIKGLFDMIKNASLLHRSYIPFIHISFTQPWLRPKGCSAPSGLVMIRTPGFVCSADSL